jgi:Helix-turn-helix domain
VPKTPRLREWRERVALSQMELAERSGTSRATIADLEALGVEPEDLYGGEYPKEQAPPNLQESLLTGYWRRSGACGICAPGVISCTD